MGVILVHDEMGTSQAAITWPVQVRPVYNMNKKMTKK